MLNNVASIAAEHNAAAAIAEGVALEARTNSDEAFTASALAFRHALLNGATVREVGDAVAAIKATLVGAKYDAADLYTAPSSVAFHARAGAVATLDGDLPEGVNLREVQKYIKKVTAAVADGVIAGATDKAAAFEGFVAAAAAKALADAEKAAAKAAAQALLDAGDEDEDEGAGAPAAAAPASKTALDLLVAATASLEVAANLIEKDGADEATLAALDSLLAILGQARTSATDIPEDAEALFV